MTTARFTIAQDGRYWFLTDGETGASWPFSSEAAAQSAATAANKTPTYLRDNNLIHTPIATSEGDGSQ